MERNSWFEHLSDESIDKELFHIQNALVMIAAGRRTDLSKDKLLEWQNQLLNEKQLRFAHQDAIDAETRIDLEIASLFDSGLGDFYNNHVDQDLWREKDSYRGGWLAAATRPVSTTRHETKQWEPSGALADAWFENASQVEDNPPRCHCGSSECNGA